MKQKELIKEIQLLGLDVKNNLECCYVLLEYLERIKNYKYSNNSYLHIDYLNFALENHLHLSILILNSLLNPSKNGRNN